MGTSRFIMAVTALTLLVALVIGFDWLPFLRGGEMFNWLWPYDPVRIGRWLMFAVIVAVYGALALWLGQRQRERMLLLWAFSGTILLTLAATWARSGSPVIELYLRTVSLTATGPFSAAGLIDWSDGAWLEWTRVMADFRSLSQHVALSPPLLPLLHHGAAGALATVPPVADTVQAALLPYQCHNYTLLEFTAAQQATAIFGVLMPLWAAFAVLPLHAIQKRLLGLETPYLAALWSLTPALILYGASWNTVYPLLGLASFWLLLTGLDGGLHPLRLIAAGLLMGVLTFANFSVVPMAMLFGFYTLLRYILTERDSYPPLRPVMAGLYFGIGVLALWAVFMLLGGESPLAMLETAFALHLELDRPFVPWLWMHFWEWTLLGSVPFALLWLARSAQKPFDAQVLPLALLATMVIMLLSNTARGETGRVWLFFVPFVLLSGALMVRSWRGWALLFVAQGALTVALVATWPVMSAAGVTPRPDTPPPVSAYTPVEAQFDAGFTLVGWQGRVVDEGLQLDLVWRADELLTTPYYFAALPVAPDGSAGDSVVWQPQQTDFPTTCWYGAGLVGDSIILPLHQAPVTGGWYVSLTAFADVDQPLATVTATLPDGTRDRQLGLGPIIVSE